MSSAEVKSLADSSTGAGMTSGKSPAGVQASLLAQLPLKRSESIRFIWVVLLAVVVGWLYFLSQPKVYEARTAFQLLSDLNESEKLQGLLPSAEEVERALLIKYDIVNKSSTKVEYPRISGVWRTADALFVSAEGRTGPEAAAFLQQEVARYLQDLQKAHRSVLSIQELKIARLKADEQDIARQIDALSPDTSRLVAQNPALLMISGVEKARLLEQLTGIRDQIETAKTDLVKVSGKGISLLRDAALSKHGEPVKPKLSTILGISGLLGALLALALTCAVRVLRGNERWSNRNFYASN